MVALSIQIYVLLLCTLYVSSHKHHPIAGTTRPGWEFVREMLHEHFASERDLGASLAIYHHGQPVVDLSGGWFDRSHTKPYDNNTLQLVFSTTKGVTAIAAAICVQRGWLNYSELVTNYWPEYGKHGKEKTTVADILAHRAGLPLEPAPLEQFVNWTAMVHALENATPLWTPGIAHSYHALTYGWLAGELIRRVDPKKRSVGQFVQEEIARPLNIEFYIGLPPSQESRVSPLVFSAETARALNESMQTVFRFYDAPEVLRAELPAANGITNARSLARLYASLIGDLDDGKQKRLLNSAVLQQAIKPTPLSGEKDFLTQTPISFGMGFMLYNQIFPFFPPSVFGHPGNHS